MSHSGFCVKRGLGLQKREAERGNRAEEKSGEVGRGVL